MQPMSHGKRSFYFYFFCLVFIVAIPLLILYAEGYHLTKDWQIAETGGMYVYAPLEGSDLFLNAKKVEQSGVFQKGILLPNLKPGSYELLVSKSGFSSWKKDIQVQSGFVAEAYPFMISDTLMATTVPEFLPPTSATTSKIANPEYTAASALFVPSATSTPDILLRGNLRLSRLKNTIVATWLGRSDSAPYYFCGGISCTATTTIFSNSSPNAHFDFLPGRDDVMVIEGQAGLTAVEFDTRTPQNSVLFYKGENVDFRVAANILYIKQSAHISKIIF